MHAWFRELEGKGVTSARLHVLEVDEDGVGAAYALSTDENVVAFESFAALEGELTTLRLDLFQDMRNLLLGTDDNTTCVWNACDPYTTRAVRGVEGFGQASNCGRTNKDGIDFVKSGTEGFERCLAPYNTPQEHGGCKDGRFFLQCKGQCPGTSIDGDWRNRTEHCDLWKDCSVPSTSRCSTPARSRCRRAPNARPSRVRSSSCGRKAVDLDRRGEALDGERAENGGAALASPAATVTSRTATSRTATPQRRSERAQVPTSSGSISRSPTSPGSRGLATTPRRSETSLASSLTQASRVKWGA